MNTFTELRAHVWDLKYMLNFEIQNLNFFIISKFNFKFTFFLNIFNKKIDYLIYTKNKNMTTIIILI